ncbi:hypothetical protein [uncultured Stenotrophomonas sp.]|uniref:hypothetical protein n=1 Tax=uncultured Stenotrophomonas sp. TaxID=165438 RepID=UPI0025D6B662|nr:hypothetical protein [uncultured Stenotrophomonas sp.]
MSTEWKHTVNAQYQRVATSIAGLSTAALVLPLVFLREIYRADNGLPLTSYLTWPAYLAWSLLLASTFITLTFQYISAKWIKNSAGAPTTLSAQVLERILDVSFWSLAITFILGILTLTYFAITLHGGIGTNSVASSHAVIATISAAPTVGRNQSELELLRQIAENTKGASGVWVAVVTAVAALLGALVSAWAGFIGMSRSAKSQGEIERAKLQATLVTAERLRWLQDLRSKIASFFTHVELQLDLLSRPHSNESRASVQQSLDDMSKQVAADGNAILLILDTEKDGQRELAESINNWLKYMNDQFSKTEHGPVKRDVPHCSKLKSEAFDALRIIGQKAWKKVQALE